MLSQVSAEVGVLLLHSSAVTVRPCCCPHTAHQEEQEALLLPSSQAWPAAVNMGRASAARASASVATAGSAVSSPRPACALWFGVASEQPVKLDTAFAPILAMALNVVAMVPVHAATACATSVLLAQHVLQLMPVLVRRVRTAAHATLALMCAEEMAWRTSNCRRHGVTDTSVLVCLGSQVCIASA